MKRLTKGVAPLPPHIGDGLYPLSNDLPVGTTLGNQANVIRNIYKPTQVQLQQTMLDAS